MRALLNYLWVISLGFGLFSATAVAQSGPATEVLESRHQEVQRLLRRPDSAARTEAVTAVLSQLLDYDALAEGALGRHWADRTGEEKAQFTALLRGLIERSYQASLTDSADFRVRYEGEQAADDAVLVSTSARSRENRRAPPVSIEYRMRPSGRSFVVTDVTTDGVSMVRNYRSQFARIIRRDGFPAVIERMQSRLAEGSSI